MGSKINEQIIPWVTYTDPELAQVGLIAAAAKSENATAEVLSIDLSRNDRAKTEGYKNGMMRIVLDGKKIIGASILAPGAGELIQPWVVAISSGLNIFSMAAYIAPYPTLGDLSKRIASSFYAKRLFSISTKYVVRFLLKLPF